MTIAPWSRRLLGALLALAVIVLGVVLRRHGVAWGLPSPGGFAISAHPDEWFVLDSLRAMSVENGDLLSKEAYVEGPLQHMLWALALAGAQRVGWIEHTPERFAGKDAEQRSQRAQVLRFLRGMVAGVDVVAMLALIVWGGRCFGFLPALLAALLYAVLPALVVQAHYARTHALANLWVVLIALLCLTIDRRWRMGRRTSPGLWALAGVLTALASATRYHMLSVGLFPAMLAVAALRWRELPLARRLVGPGLALLAFAVTLLVAMPALWLEPDLVRRGIEYTSTFAQTSEFSGASLWSFARVWAYLDWLIPIGSYPLLWLVLYAGVLGALALAVRRRDVAALAIPLYALIYLYLTAKGYAQPVFVRAALPFLAAAVLAVAYVIGAMGRIRFARPLAALVVIALVVPSARYAWAYGTGMEDVDPRLKAAAWIKRQVPRDVPVGIVWPYPWFFTPPIRNPIVADALHQTPTPAWLVVSSFEAKDPRVLSPDYQLRQEFQTLPHIGKRRVIDHARWPDDWVYPFPRVWVLEKKAGDG